MFRSSILLAFLLAGYAVHAEEPRSLSLDEAIALAGATSESGAIARAGAERADANVDRTASQRKPQLNASASYMRTLQSQFQNISGGEAPELPPGCEGPWTPDPSLPLEERVRLLEQRLACPSSSPFGGIDFSQLGFGAPNTWNLGFAFHWPFFTGGRVEAQTRAAEELREVAAVNIESTDARTRLEVTAAYFDAQLAGELVDISEASLANSEETLRITTLRAREGAQAEFDVLQARVTRDNQRPLLIRRRTMRDLALDRLRALIDLPPGQPLLLTTPITVPPTRDVELDVDPLERVAVTQAASRAEAARHQLTAARAQRMPTIAVQSQYGLVQYSDSLLPDVGGFQKNWTVGAALQVPVYSGGRIAAEVRMARADVAEAEALLEQVIEASRLDTASALAEVRAARATHEATEGTVEQAARGYELARLRYQEGVSIPLEVENARLLLEQARVNRAQSARDLHLAITRIELLPLLPLGASISSPGSPQPQPPMQQPQTSGAAPTGGLD